MLIEYVSIKLVWDIYIVTEIFNDIYIYINYKFAAFVYM